MTNEQVESLLEEYRERRVERDLYVRLWEDVAYFGYRREMNFVGGTQNKSNAFLTYGSVYTPTPQTAMRLLSSALLGAIWKNGARTFRLLRPKYIPDTEEINSYFEFLNETVVSTFEHPRAGLMTALGEYMRGQTSFGTSGIGVYANADIAAKSVPLVFKSYSVASCTLIESAEGKIIGCFIEDEMKAEHLIARFQGNVSEKVMRGQKTAMIKYIQCIKERPVVKAGSLSKLDLPYMSTYIELDTKHVLEESGFYEMPIKFARFEKNCGEIYGRSPMTESMPSIWELNKAIQQLHLSIELSNDPPKALLDDGAYGGGIIDQSPGAFSVIDVSGRIGSNPIIDLYKATDLQSLAQLVDNLKVEISEAFYLDKLFDLNNKTRQTLGEAQIRNELRSEPLSAIIVRQLEEMEIPLIETAINLLFQMGRLGVIAGSDQEKMLLAQGIVPTQIPNEVAQVMFAGFDFYSVQFISPAARMLRAEELRGIQESIGFAAQLQPADPTALMRYDLGESIKLVNELNGAPESLLKSEEVFQADVQAMQERQAAAVQAEMEDKRAEINKKNASAEQSRAQATMAMKNANSGMGGAIQDQPTMSQPDEMLI